MSALEFAGELAINVLGSLIAVAVIEYPLIRLVGWRALFSPVAAFRGWAAEDAGRGLVSNPYQVGTRFARAWEAGWKASQKVNV